MDLVPPVPPEQQIVSPEVVARVPVSKSKNKILMWMVGGAIVLGIGIMVGFFLNKSLDQTPKVIPTPTPLPVSEVTPTPDSTTDWKTYPYPEFGYSFRAPITYSTNLNSPNPSDPTILQSIDLNEKNASQGPNDLIITVQSTNLESSLKELVQENQFVTKGTKIVGDKEWTMAASERTGETQYLIQSENKTYTVDGRNATFLGQILSTFKFIETSPQPTLKPAKTFKYSLPEGWKTISSENNEYAISLDPAIFMDVCTSVACSIILKSDQIFGYGIYYVQYSGGSRRVELEKRYGNKHDDFVEVEIDGKKGLLTIFYLPSESGGNKLVAGIPSGNKMIIFSSTLNNNFSGRSSGFDQDYEYKILGTLRIE